MTHLDPRIGTLNSGQFYAFVDGYDAPEVVGTLQEVEVALGLRSEVAAPVPSQGDRYTVTLRFQYPAWDEVGGIVYSDVLARSKAEAIATVRNMARSDGHAMSGKGRYWFTAEEGE